MQSQKFTAVVESMQRGETLVALKTISTLVSKEKNKAKLSENELKLIYVLKALCLSKIHEYGESYSLITNFLKNEKDVLFSEGNVIHWLDYIASGLHLYKEVREFSGNFYNKVGNKEEHLIEYMNLCIKECNYHEAFSSALRLYKLNNNLKYMFINVIYQYQQVVKNTTEADIPKKLEIVFLFTEKLLKELKIGTETPKIEKIHKQAVKFSFKVCQKQGKFLKAQEILMKFLWAFEDSYELLQHFYDLYQVLKTEETRISLINMHYSRFKRDENLDTFAMEYQIYEKFIEFLFENLQDLQFPESFFSELTSKDETSSEVFQAFKEIPTNNEIILDLLRNLNVIKRKTLKEKSHKNFKNALQIFLSAELFLLLRSLNFLANNLEQKALIIPFYQKALAEYLQEYANTMTFAEEFQVLTKGAPEEILHFSIELIEKEQKEQKEQKDQKDQKDQKEQKDDQKDQKEQKEQKDLNKEQKDQKDLHKDQKDLHKDQKEQKPLTKYIKEISLMKLKLAWNMGETPEKLEGVFFLIKKALKLYEQAFLELELETRLLEKGERHFIDDFLLISADVLLVKNLIFFLKITIF